MLMRIEMCEQQPAAYEVGGRAPRHYHQLTEQHEPDEADVLVPYAHVHYCLRQERHHQLQQASEREAEEDVEEIFPVLLQVTEKEAERAFLILRDAVFLQNFSVGWRSSAIPSPSHGNSC